MASRSIFIFEELCEDLKKTIEYSNGQIRNTQDLKSICQAAIRLLEENDYGGLINYVIKKNDYPNIKVQIRFSDKIYTNSFKTPTKQQLVSNLSQLMDEISRAPLPEEEKSKLLADRINQIRNIMSEEENRVHKNINPALINELNEPKKVLAESEFKEDGNIMSEKENRFHKDINPALINELNELKKVLAESEFREDKTRIKKPYWLGRLDRIRGVVRVLTSVRLGDFRSSKAHMKTGTITLYIKALADFAEREKIGFETVFFATLIHEYFHALHYHLFKQHGMEDRWSEKWFDDERRIVQETLATFYEWYHCKDGFLCYVLPDSRRLADHLLEEWKSLDIDFWPYSGASVLAVHDYNGPTLGMLFLWLLETSINDWALAAKAIKALYYIPQIGLVKAEIDLLGYEPRF